MQCASTRCDVEEANMHPADFSDPETLYCTLARMIYARIRKSQDPQRDKAMNPMGLVIPWDDRSAKTRHFWETVVREALESMGIIGDTAHELIISQIPARLELDRDRESIFED